MKFRREKDEKEGCWLLLSGWLPYCNGICLVWLNTIIMI